MDRRRRAAGRPEGHAGGEDLAEDQGWNFAEQFGQKEPDLIIKSYDVHDAGRVAGRLGQARHRTGITEPRWVRAIEIRPEFVKGRKITHHAIAYLEQDEPGAPASAVCPCRSWNGRSASRAR